MSKVIDMSKAWQWFKGERPGVTLVGTAAFVVGLVILHAALKAKVGSLHGHVIVNALVAGGLLGAIVPVAANKLNADDSSTLQSINALLRAELGAAMGIIAGLVVLAGAVAANQNPSAATIAIAAAAGAAGALRVARGLQSRADGIIKVTTPEATTSVPVGAGPVQVDHGNGKTTLIKQGP